MAEVADLLKRVPFIQNFSDEHLKELVRIGGTVSWGAGQIVFLEGAPSDGLYVILAGQVKIYKRDSHGQEVELARLAQGNFFGELALFDGAARSATVVTLEPCEFFVVGREDILRLVGESPRVALALLADMSGRIRSSNDRFFLQVMEQAALRVDLERARYRSLARVAAAANEAPTFEKALRLALDQVCAFTGWPIGHAYLAQENAEGSLFSSGIWYLKGPEQFEPFRKISEITAFPRGIELPGGILANGKPAWVEDLAREPGSPRAEVAREVGVRAGFGIPVRAGNEVAAVLEFFSEQPQPQDDLLLESIAALGSQLGRVLERNRFEEKLLYNALHDELTGLPKRRSFLLRLKESVAHAQRDPNYLWAVLYLGVDRFKLVNDSLGHEIGDELLVEVGRRLQACVRPMDTLARLGGDAFAILLDDLGHIGNVPRVVLRIQNQFQRPFRLNERETFASVGIGIATSSTGYGQAEQVLRDADTALYRAKAQGPGRFEVFDAPMQQQATHLFELQSDLRRAIDHKELRVHYQPIVRLETGQLVGFEALLRWLHPDRGLLGPAEFLECAEETELIIPITQWVLREVCRQIRRWQAQFPANPPVPVSVNLSTKYLATKDPLQDIAALISQNGLPPSSLGLEITESQIMKNPEAMAKLFVRFSDMGIKLSLDDFGTGYSSLSYLSDFRFHALKIDRSFVGKLTQDRKNAAIVRAIVSLGESLGLDVIAEGVETLEQLRFLESLRCRYAQGYYFSRPLEIRSATHLLANGFETDRRKLPETPAGQSLDKLLSLEGNPPPPIVRQPR